MSELFPTDPRERQDKVKEIVTEVVTRPEIESFLSGYSLSIVEVEMKNHNMDVCADTSNSRELRIRYSANFCELPISYFRAVLFHELGHIRNEDIFLNFVKMFLNGIYVISVLLLALKLRSFWFAAIGTFVAILFETIFLKTYNFWKREFAADDFSAQHNSPQDLIAFFEFMRSTYNDDFFFTHPSYARRIARLKGKYGIN